MYVTLVKPLRLAEGASGEKEEFEVYQFTGAGGVAIAMYNTDEVSDWAAVKPKNLA